MSVEGEKLIREILVRLSRIETQGEDINEIKVELKKQDEAQRKLELDNKSRLESVDASTKSAHKRIDKLDKIVWWVGTLLIGLLLTAIVVNTMPN